LNNLSKGFYEVRAVGKNIGSGEDAYLPEIDNLFEPKAH